MTTADLTALLPIIVLGASSVAIMLVIAFHRDHTLTSVLTEVGLALAFIALRPAAEVAPRQVTALLVVDHYALFFMGLLLAAAFIVAALSYGYLERREEFQEEFYLLLLLATLGALVLAASSHFASFFLGLETLTVSLYALIAYQRTRDESIGAGMKYLVLGGASTAFLLFGMALVYAESGTMEFVRLARVQLTGEMALAGLAMMIVGIGFKLAIVPFHMWTPDVYQGAPAPVTAYVATVSKGAMFALVLRYFWQVNLQSYHSLTLTFTMISIASMFAGNLLALLQNNIKRLLAYSSIAHLGYLLGAFLASGPLAATAATFYLVAYFVTTLAAFGVVTVMSDQERDADSIEDYQGLFWRRPWLAGVLTVSLLSLAGIPLTAGFIGKFYIVAAGIGSSLWLLVILLVVNSAIGLFYYLRVTVAMFARAPEGKLVPVALPLVSGVVLAGLALMLIWLGIYPAPLVHIIQATVGRLI
jgi:NADH-quinone oxidoreductase subunit N